MKEITKKWIAFARADLDAAALQIRYGERQGSAYQIAVFHCHQAIEKLLKAHLVEREKEVKKSHDLTHLRTLVGVKLPQDIVAFIDELQPHYLLPRYPDLSFQPAFSFTYNRRNTQKILDITRKAFLWLEQQFKGKK